MDGGLFTLHQAALVLAHARGLGDAGQQSITHSIVLLFTHTQARMDGGLFTLHQAALVLAHAWGLGDAGLRKRILGVLHQRSHSLGHVR